MLSPAPLPDDVHDANALLTSALAAAKPAAGLLPRDAALQIVRRHLVRVLTRRALEEAGG